MIKHVMLELSTAHLSKETLDELTANTIESVMSYGKTVGWLGSVGCFVPITGQEENLPSDLESCIRFAEKLGADWIMFDDDAEVIEELALYI